MSEGGVSIKVVSAMTDTYSVYFEGDDITFFGGRREIEDGTFRELDVDPDRLKDEWRLVRWAF